MLFYRKYGIELFANITISMRNRLSICFIPFILFPMSEAALSVIISFPSPPQRSQAMFLLSRVLFSPPRQEVGAAHKPTTNNSDNKRQWRATQKTKERERARACLSSAVAQPPALH